MSRREILAPVGWLPPGQAARIALRGLTRRLARRNPYRARWSAYAAALDLLSTDP